MILPYLQAEPAGCQYCRAGVGALYKDFASKEGVEIEGHILVAKVCSALDDPKGCEKGVEAWWGKIAAVLFSEEGAKYTCKALSKGQCEAFRVK